MPPSQCTELIVVRHGETVWNVQGRLQGHLDSDLTTLGCRQADATAKRLARETFHVLYSSDLGRAYRTAERVAQQTGHAIITDRRLRERNLGIFQGLTYEEIRSRFSQEYEPFKARHPNHAMPQGESACQQYHRIVECVKEMTHRHKGQRVVLVTHGGVLGILFRHALNIPLSAPRSYKLYNASINTFFIEGHTWTLGSWGDTLHLDGLASLDDGADTNGLLHVLP